MILAYVGTLITGAWFAEIGHESNAPPLSPKSANGHVTGRYEGFFGKFPTAHPD